MNLHSRSMKWPLCTVYQLVQYMLQHWKPVKPKKKMQQLWFSLLPAACFLVSFRVNTILILYLPPSSVSQHFTRWQVRARNQTCLTASHTALQLVVKTPRVIDNETNNQTNKIWLFSGLYQTRNLCFKTSSCRLKGGSVTALENKHQYRVARSWL